VGEHKDGEAARAQADPSLPELLLHESPQAQPGSLGAAPQGADARDSSKLTQDDLKVFRIRFNFRSIAATLSKPHFTSSISDSTRFSICVIVMLSFTFLPPLIS